MKHIAPMCSFQDFEPMYTRVYVKPRSSLVYAKGAKICTYKATGTLSMGSTEYLVRG